MPKNKEKAKAKAPKFPKIAEQLSIVRNFFKDNPNSIKRKKDDSVKESYINLNGYGILKRRKNLGKGTYNRVKLYAQPFGKSVALAVKVSKHSSTTLSDTPAFKRNGHDVTLCNAILHSKNILMTLNRYLGGFERNNKDYQFIPFIEGEDLHHFLRKNANLSKNDRFILANYCATALFSLHQKNIVHGDISLSNLMVRDNGKEKTKTIEIIDFDFSFQLESPTDYIIYVDANGAPRKLNNIPSRWAPEQNKESRFSLASDIYSLGHLFKNHLGLTGSLINCMLDEDPNKRPNIKEVLLVLKNTAYEITNAKNNHPPINSNPIFIPSKSSESTSQSKTCTSDTELLASKSSPARFQTPKN